MGCIPTKIVQVPLEGMDVYKKYKFGSTLGAGASSQIFEATDRETDSVYAIKCVVNDEETEKDRRKELRKQAELMREFDHEHICRLYEFFEDQEICYFVLEPCPGGPLFDWLEDDIVLAEDQAAQIVKAMVMGLAHVHSKEICHRDIKPENFLLAERRGDNEKTIPLVKLIDFGTAVRCGSTDIFSETIGTLHYVAPEVLKGQYGRPSDMWSLGVCTFLMVYAKYPYDGESTPDVMKGILQHEPDWSDSCYALSDGAKDFMISALHKNPKSRITAPDAVEHYWLKPSDPGKENVSSARKSKLLPRYSIIGGDALNSLPAFKQAEKSRTRISNFGQTRRETNLGVRASTINAGNGATKVERASVLLTTKMVDKILQHEPKLLTTTEERDEEEDSDAEVWIPSRAGSRHPSEVKKHDVEEASGQKRSTSRCPTGGTGIEEIGGGPALDNLPEETQDVSAAFKDNIRMIHQSAAEVPASNSTAIDSETRKSREKNIQLPGLATELSPRPPSSNPDRDREDHSPRSQNPGGLVPLDESSKKNRTSSKIQRQAS